MKKFIPLILFIILITLIAFGTYKISNQKTSDLIDQKLPTFSLAKLYNQKQKFSNDDLSKNQYSLINFFASWCNSCLIEHQHLLKFKENKKINLYGIAWRDIDDNTKKFIEKHGNPYQIIAIDSKNEFGKEINLQGVPESIVINKSGKIVYHHRGPVTNLELLEIDNLIN